MACFLVPAAEAIVTTVVAKSLDQQEKTASQQMEKVHFSQKLKALNKLLCGGAVLLAFEHVWHGEVAPFFPFLTGAATAESTAEMLHEMSTVGVGMAIATTLVWGVGCVVVDRLAKKAKQLI